MKKLIILFLFPALLNAQTTYYFSQSEGDDSNNGTSELTPWHSMRKYRSATFQAGDTIRFKRGDTWVVNHSDSVLRMERSGTEGNYTRYTAYGDEKDPKPIFTARRPIPGWDVEGNWTETALGSNEWYTAIYTSPTSWRHQRLWISGTEVMKGPGVTNTNTGTEVSAAYPWNWDNDNALLYVYSVGNPATEFTNLETFGYGWVARIFNASWVWVDSLDIQGGYQPFNILHAHNIVIEYCNIGRYSALDGMRVNDNSTQSSTNGIIRYCTFDTGVPTDSALYYKDHYVRPTEDGLTLRAYTQGWEVHDNSFINWSHIGVSMGSRDYTRPIINNRIYNNFITAPDLSYARAFGMSGDGANPGYNTGNEFFNNYIYQTATKSQISGDGYKIYNNIIDGVSGYYVRTSSSPYISWRVGAGLSLEGIGYGKPWNNEIYNNIFMNCEGPGLSLWRKTLASGEETAHGNIIRNNIFIDNGKGASDYQFEIQNDPNNPTGSNTIENNLFFAVGVTNIIHNQKLSTPAISVTTFNALVEGDYGGYPVDVVNDNIQDDPDMVDPPNDYSLSLGSPAIGAGYPLTLSGADYAGNAWADPPSIGAFEYDATPPANYTLTITIVGTGTVEINGTPYTTPLTFALDEVVNLEAIAAVDWQFNGWTGDLISTSAEEDIIMNGNKSITATFTLPPAEGSIILHDLGLNEIILF